MMEPTFGVLDAVTFVVFALLITVAVILVVSLGQLVSCQGSSRANGATRRRPPSM
jgi:hypothetical protein